MMLLPIWLLLALQNGVILGDICPNRTESCEDVICPDLLRCDFPKKSIDYCEPSRGCCMKRVCTCRGTVNGLASTGTPKKLFDRAEWVYTNCTLVEGNIELVSIESNVTFTRHIEQVTGYVIVSRFYGSYIDFSSLRLIRGNLLYQDPPDACKGTAYKSFLNANNMTSTGKDARKYALYVDSNRMGKKGLKELWLPNLTEITKGDVLFQHNSYLCHIDTIKWSDIFENTEVQVSMLNISANLSRTCPPCSNSCVSDEGVRHCWGSSPDLCQLLTKTNCNSCNRNYRRCVVENGVAAGCCNENCAGGCSASSDTNSCYGCKMLSDDGRCVTACPQGQTVDPTTNRVIETTKKLQFVGYCVKECPDNVPQFELFCQTYCPTGYFDFSSNTCKRCESCDYICPGLGVKGTKLENDTSINSLNIKYFHKNCTIIEGSLHFKRTTFEGDRHCHVNKTLLAEFDRFQNVREITGYLVIEEWPDSTLCIFKNLQKIDGKELLHGQYALSVFTDNVRAAQLRSLCFNSLKQIDRGIVMLFNQYLLCYANQVPWNDIVLHPFQHNTSISINTFSENCGNVLMKNRRLCFQHTVDWNSVLLNPSKQTFLIKGKNRKSCAPCSSNCNDTFGCWGSGSDQCLKCQYFTDLTNSEGDFTKTYVLEDGKLYPGNNVTTCVKQCDASKGVYASPDNLCLPCHKECLNECSGPHSAHCQKCLNYDNNGTCVPSCNETIHYVVNRTCHSCSSGCIDGGCAGPLNAFDTVQGCKACYFYRDNEANMDVYEGRNCQKCTELPVDCPHGCKGNGTGLFTCIEVPGEYLVQILVPIFVVLFLVIIVVFFFCLRRKKSTINQMRKTIGETMVGEHNVDDLETMPLTPSGAAPNQAHLRIVKDNELTLGRLLGSGAFGEVHKAIWTPINIQGEKIKIAVAVKTLKTPEDMSPGANNEIMDEAYVMASVDCDYLVRLLGIRMTENVSLITQLMPLGSLLDYVREVKNHETFCSRQILTWFVQISKGMLYLQEKHLVHRDLAARNVLVKTPNHVKITDFGLAKMLDISEDAYQAEGGKLPIKWLAIECITERLFSHLSDVWAYGITCWEILTFGARPYEGVRAVEILSLLERGERLQQPPTATIEVYMLLVKCWMVDRTSRPSFAELVSEFSRMAMDPMRYLVLQNDMENCFSPNPAEESQFFQCLLQEEKIDDAMIADEPDQYLLSRDLNNEPDWYTPMSSLTVPLLQPNTRFEVNRPVYANQEALDKTQSTHPTRRGPERLFSRTTPSANLDPIAESSTSTERARDSDLTRIASISETDDVFSEAAHSAKHMNRDLQIETRNNRKDSEENHRYTEDPTNKKMISRSADSEKLPKVASPSSSAYDEEQYLRPIESTLPVYLDPEGEPEFSQTSALVNDTYIDSPPFNAGSPPSDINKPISPGYTHLASCAGRNGPEYVNTREKETNNWFANEEYMTTDSGIGEDTQSLLSRGATGKNRKQTESSHSSSDENDPLKNDRVAFKPTQNHNGLSRSAQQPCSTSSESSTISCSSPTALNNPGYILLNASVSNNSNKNLEKVKPETNKDETSV